MKMKYVFICASALLITGALVGGAIRYPRKTSNQDTSVTPTRLPQMSSAINKLEIVNVFIEDRALNIVVRNNAEKGIQALTVSAGDYSLTLDEGLGTDYPKPIIKAGSDFTIDIPIVNLKTTIPVVVSGVIYDDNTEDGNGAVVKEIRKARETEKLKRLKKTSGEKANS